jgi:hypothetical protein
VTRTKLSTPVIRTFAVLFALVAVAAALAAPAHAAFPGQNGKLVFDDAFLSIRVVNPDGSGNTVLQSVGAGYYLYDAAWSPDGTKIVFVQNDDDNASPSTDVMNADGTGRTTILGGAPDHPSWSPDGRWIAFSAGGIWKIRYPPDGSPPAQLLSDVNPTFPEWSPDGSKIAFASYAGASDYDIYTMNALDGSDLVKLTDGPERDVWPEWSPDGQHIAFTRGYLYVNGQVDRMNADGTGITQLTDDPRSSGVPAWSPDGRKIAFLRADDNDGLRIWTMNADGSTEQDIGVRAPESGLDWQPILHDAPQAADTITTSLVPAFRQTISSTQCQARGGTPSTHGAPLSLSSCNPPGYLPNTTARLGPQGSGSIQLAAVAGNIATLADEADLAFTVNATDVRDRRTGADYDPSAGGADVTLVPRPRISDTYNSPTLHHPATVRDLDFFVPVDCAATPDPLLGATCSASTSADAVLSGAIREGERTIWQAFRLWLRDSGANDVRGDTDDRLFAQSGVYIP